MLVQPTAWNQCTLDLLAATTNTAASRFSLKAAYRSVYGKGARGLDEVIQQRTLTLAPNSSRGRAARRLAGAVAITRFLHARARGHAPISADRPTQPTDDASPVRAEPA